MVQKQLKKEENKHLNDEIKHLNMELGNSVSYVDQMNDLLQQKDKKVKKAVRKRQMRTSAHVDLSNEFTGAQMVLEEAENSKETLEKNL